MTLVRSIRLRRMDSTARSPRVIGLTEIPRLSFRLNLLAKMDEAS